MSRTRPYPIDRSAPRYNIRKTRGHGQLVGCGWTEPYARRLAARLAEMYGEPVNLLDTWKRRRIRSYTPSAHAVARAKAQAQARQDSLTSGGQNGGAMHMVMLGPRRPKESGPLSDRAEIPENLPRRPTLPTDFLLEADTQ